MDEIQLYKLFFTLLVLYYAWYITRSKKSLPPSPPKLPIIGNPHQISKLPHRSLWQLSKKHGPLMFLKLGSRPTLVVSSAEVGKEIMKTHDLSFADRPVLIAQKKLLYDMTDLLNLPYGKKWRKLRSIFVHQLLSSTRVKSFSSIREEETRLLVEKIKACFMSSSPVNLTDLFTSLSNDLISRAAFGKKYIETEHGKKFLELLDEAAGLFFNFTLGEFVPWLGWMNWLNCYNATLDKCVKKRDEVLDAITEHYLAESGDGGDHDHKSKQCFVDILVDSYKGNAPGVSIDLITLKGAILDIFAAGTETSATVSEWVMTELIRHPRIMKKLHDEIREIMQGRHNITDDDLQKMHYLKAVIKETFRYHPPVTIYFHSCREHVNLMGYDIEPETIVLINAWAIGRDPTYWPEPEKFMPERFLNSSVDFRGFDFQLIPFGGGRRICPGLEFANSTLEHTVANLMHKFDWTLPNGVKGELDVMEKPGFTIGRKNPLIVVATKSYF